MSVEKLGKKSQFESGVFRKEEAHVPRKDLKRAIEEWEAAVAKKSIENRYPRSKATPEELRAVRRMQEGTREADEMEPDQS